MPDESYPANPLLPRLPEASGRALPLQPSLEHLRKESKQLCTALQAQAHSTRLADAQLVLARGYGFASWRALKAEVERRVALRSADGSARPEISLGHYRTVPRRSALFWDSGQLEGAFFPVISICMLLTQFAGASAAYRAAGIAAARLLAPVLGAPP